MFLRESNRSTALKTLALRLRGAKVELEEAGLETENMAESTATLQAKLKALTHGKVDIMEDAETFKSTTQILREMADAWEYMTDIERASALELMGGKRQANILSSLISNFDIVEDVIQTSANSANSAIEENAKYLDSMQGRIDQLTNSMQAMWVHALDSEVLKDLISLADTFVQLTDKVGLFNAAMAVFMGKSAFGAKKFGALNMIPGLANAASGAMTKLGMSASAAATGFSIFNAVATAGISLLAGVVISGLIKVADELIVTSEEIKEAASQASDAIKSLSSDFKDTEKFVSSSAERFAELAQGVDMLTGKNLSLTTDDYEEFLNLSNQLAEVFPTLSRNYDENGNAIVQLSGDTDTMVSSLKQLLDAQRQITNQKIAENLPDLYAGIKLKSDDFNAELEKLESDSLSYQNRLEILQTDVIDTINELFDNGSFKVSNDEQGIMLAQNVRKVLEQAGMTIHDFVEKDFLGNVTGYTYTLPLRYSDADIEEARGKIASGIDTLSNEYTTKINELNTEIQTVANENKANWSSILSSVSSWLSTDSSYKVLNDDMQSVVQTMINNIDFSKLDNVDTWEGMQSYIKENIISKIQSVTPEVQQAFSQLFKIKTDGKTTEGYIGEIKKQAQKIADSSDFTYDEVLKNTGYQDIITKYETSAQNILKVLDDSIPKHYEKYEASTAAYADYLDLYGAEVDALKDKIYSLSPENMTRAFDIIKKYGINTWDELVEALENKTFDVVVDLDTEKTGIDNLLSAIDESISATGVSSESIANLKARYQDLENYDPSRLFETTANGIHLNVQALEELESAYEKQNKSAIDEKLKGLTEQYNDLTLEIENCNDASERALLYAQRSNVIDQINDTATLAAQYEGLTSVYNKWQKAQSNGDERDMYEGILSGKEEMDEEISRGWIDDGTRAYLELLSGQDLSAAPYEKILDVYKQLNQEIGDSGYNVYDFFTQDKNGNSTTDGIFNFFDAVMSKQKELGKNWITIGKDGSYNFDFGVNGDKAIADALGISEELVQIILRAARDAGFDINLDSAYSELAYLEDEAESANKKLQELGATEYTFNINSTDIDDVEQQIVEAQKALDHFRNEDGSINVDLDGAEEAQRMLASLIYQKQTLDTAVILRINVENPDSDIETTVKKMQDFKAAFNEFEVKAAIGADTKEAEANIKEVLDSLSSEEKKIMADLGIDVTKSNEEINAAINAITSDKLIELGLDTTLVDQYTAQEHTTKGKVIWENNIDAVTSWIEQEHIAPGTVEWDDDTSNLTTYYTGKGVIYWDEGGGVVNGTAHASGTANAGGTWGAKKTETSLVGELGPEILVRNGRWQTVGEHGAEFTQVKKGDIIFNHKQTESLLKNGYVTGRGKSYAGGTAYSDGNGPGRVTIASTAINAGSSLSDDAKDAADEFREVFDWIEVRLEEINEDLDLKNAKLENKVGYSAQNKVIDDMIDLNHKLYDNLTNGAEEYHKYAAELLKKVPEEYRAAAQDGSIAIEEFIGEADEETFEAISDYREWVQKGADATQQAEETLTEISNLAKQAIDNIASDFENKTSLNDSKISQLEAYNSLLETDKGFESEDIYNALIDVSNANIKKLKEQRDAMQSELNAQVEAGNIEKYSQAWYDAVNAISDVDTQIIELTADTEDYQDAINELHWEHFDTLMSQYEMIAEEAENLIDILGTKDVVDEVGNWTDEGVTALGLYAQKMEVAEMQAKKYEEEIAYLNKNWKKLGYTEAEYIDKLDELKSGQYDAIKAYNDTKDAIVDLNKERVDAIKEGIEKEIEAYEELINKKKEELDAEKDLHDFQKGVADQQKEIADIERKLAALSADNSASARAKRAQLEAELAEARAELEETYYERSISDQQEALDKELENFQQEKDAELESWDEYLDNTELVVSDSLAVVQENTNIVYRTLQEMGEEYSLSITESLTSPWKDGEDAIQSYSEKFGLSMSSTVEELKNVAEQYKKIIDDIDGYSEDAIDQVDENINRYKEASKVEKSQEQNKETSKDQTEPNKNQDAAKQEEQYEIYTVKQYDTLSKIAEKELGSSSRWKEIYELNKDQIANPNIIYANQKFKIPKYANGTVGARKDQWSIIDELGEELRLIPDGNGRLAYMKKGTGVVPADLTANLMEWGKLDPTNMLEQNKPQIGVSPSVVNNTTEIHIDASVGELLHVEHLEGNNPAEISKIVDKAWDKHMKELNAHVRRYTNR